MTEEMVPQSGTGGDLYKYKMLSDNTTLYNLPSFTENEIGSPEMRKEMVQQNHSGIEGKSIESTLTDDNVYVTFSVGMCSELASGYSFVKMLKIYIYFTDRTDQSDKGFEVDAKQNKSIEDVEPGHLNFMNVEPRQGCDNTKMYVPTSDEGRYTKKLCCYFCHKRYAKLARHLAAVHKNEKEVKKFITLPIGKIYFFH